MLDFAPPPDPAPLEVHHILKSTRSFYISLLTIAITGCAAHPALDSEGSTCLQAKPPADSKLIPTHGVDLLISPASISKDFTGCQSVWSESGELLMTSRFSRGAILTADIFDPEEEKVTCIYNNGRSSTGLPEKCLAPLKLIE